MPLLFEWHGEKAKTNLEKHGVSFDEAKTVFADPHQITIADPDHSHREDRFIIMGMSSRRRLMVVVHRDQERR
jgi:uncharacterized DUF497 family protein